MSKPKRHIFWAQTGPVAALGKGRRRRESPQHRPGCPLFICAQSGPIWAHILVTTIYKIKTYWWQLRYMATTMTPFTVFNQPSLIIKPTMELSFFDVTIICWQDKLTLHEIEIKWLWSPGNPLLRRDYVPCNNHPQDKLWMFQRAQNYLPGEREGDP